jgi:hypothetical protein
MINFTRKCSPQKTTILQTIKKLSYEKNFPISGSTRILSYHLFLVEKQR